MPTHAPDLGSRSSVVGNDANLTHIIYNQTLGLPLKSQLSSKSRVGINFKMKIPENYRKVIDNIAHAR